MSQYHITILGEKVNCGTYLLIIQLTQEMHQSFGRFIQGDAVFLPKGRYGYIGSARGRTGASSLGARLMRHTCRCQEAHSHPIQEILLTYLLNTGISAKVPAEKTCRWHIDYLLQSSLADLSEIIILRSDKDLEHKIADRLAALPETGIPAKGIGASDHPGGTHLFHIQAEPAWWQNLPGLLLEIAFSDDEITKI